MTHFADELEQELLRVARRRAARGSESRHSRLPVAVTGRALRAAPALMAAVLALAIVVGAFAVLRAHRSGARTGNPDPGTVQRVVAQYSIFRRPQAAADRALPPRLSPGHVLAALTRLLGVIDGHRVFVAIAGRQPRLTGWLITMQGPGAGEGSFRLFPARGAAPPLEQLGHRSVAFVPDAVTRVVWRSYLGAAVTTHPHGDIDYGPYPLGSWGATLYAGSRELAEVAVPLAYIRLRSAASAAGETATATIERDAAFASRGVTSIEVLARHVPAGRRETYGVWLYGGPSREHFIGRLSRAIWPKGDELAGAVLPGDYRAYRNLLITRGTAHNPGAIVFEAPIPRPSLSPLSGG